MAEHDRQIIADQILKAIEYGELPREEIERRLNQIIDDELSSDMRDEADMTKVDMCNSLLWRLYTHGEVGYVDRSEESRRRVEKRLQKSKQWHKGIRWGLRTAAIIVILLCVSATLGLLPSVHWFHTASTPDEQQYLITGREISTQLVANAISGHEQSGAITTQSKDDLIQFLGFDPGMPDSLRSTYFPIIYDASVGLTSIRVICKYSVSESDTDTSPMISIRMTMFSSVEDAYVPYEQDAQGEKTQIRGMPVYKFTNAGNSYYLWMEDHSIIRFVTSLSFSEAEKFVEEIIEWRQER